MSSPWQINSIQTLPAYQRVQSSRQPEFDPVRSAGAGLPLALHKLSGTDLAGGTKTLPWSAYSEVQPNFCYGEETFEQTFNGFKSCRHLGRA